LVRAFLSEETYYGRDRAQAAEATGIAVNGEQ
jgi:hypothetical protein